MASSSIVKNSVLRTLFSMAILIASLSTGAARADEVILFVNLNGSQNELNHLQDTAKKTGRRLVAVPSDLAAFHARRAQLMKDYEALHKEYERLIQEPEKAPEDVPPTDAMQRLKWEMRKFEAENRSRGDIVARSGILQTKQRVRYEERQLRQRQLDEIRKRLEEKGNEVYNDRHALKLVKEESEKLTKAGATISTLAVSGHNGGGIFSGSIGGVSIPQIENALPASVKGSIREVALMGCYAGTRSQIAYLKSFLPKMDMTIGYDGSAPLENRSASGTYVKEALIASRDLQQECDEKKLKKLIQKNVPTEKWVTGTLYVKGRCGDYFYSRVENTLEKLTFEDCPAKKDDFLKNDLPKLKQFYSGEIPVPDDTQGGEMRQLYSKLRRVDYCFFSKGSDTPDLRGNGFPIATGQQAMQLLFWKNYRVNVGRQMSQNLKHQNAQESLTKITAQVSDQRLSKEERAASKFFSDLGRAILHNPRYFESFTREQAGELAHLATKYSDDLPNGGWLQHIIHSGVQSHLYDLQGPFNWHDPLSDDQFNQPVQMRRQLLRALR